MNGRAAAEQNHLGADQSDEQVLMDGCPVRFGDTMDRDTGNLFQFLEIYCDQIQWQYFNTVKTHFKSQ